MAAGGGGAARAGDAGGGSGGLAAGGVGRGRGFASGHGLAGAGAGGGGAWAAARLALPPAGATASAAAPRPPCLGGEVPPRAPAGRAAPCGVLAGRRCCSCCCWARYCAWGEAWEGAAPGPWGGGAGGERGPESETHPLLRCPSTHRRSKGAGSTGMAAATAVTAAADGDGGWAVPGRAKDGRRGGPPAAPAAAVPAAAAAMDPLPGRCRRALPADDVRAASSSRSAAPGLPTTCRMGKGGRCMRV